MIIIGAGSRAKQGKSLFCATIIEQCSRQGIRCVEYSISSAILAYCIREGILPPDATRETCDPNVLVRVGNEKRSENKHFWIGPLGEQIETERPAVALLPNVRFPTEHGLVTDLGGWNARITRYNENGTRYISPDRDPNDLCEVSLDHARFDFEIHNMYAKPYWLRRQAIALFDYLREGAE